MNLCGSLPNHENRIIYDGAPPQGLFRGTAGRVFLNCLFQIRRGDDRLRGGGDHCTWRRVKKNLVSYQNSSIFMGNAQFQAKRWKGVSPPPLWLPRCDYSRTGATHHRSAQGRHRGTGTVPSFIRTSILNFISKENLQSQKILFCRS